MHTSQGSSHIQVPAEPIPEELQDSLFDDDSQAPKGTLVGPLEEPIASRPRPAGAGLAQGGCMSTAPGWQVPDQPDPLLNPVLRPDTFRREIPGVGRITRTEPDWRHGKMLHVCGEPVSGRGHVGCSSDHGHWNRFFKHSCSNLECPVCWEHGIIKEARRISERLHGYVDSITGQQSLTETFFGEDYTWHLRNAQNVRHIILSTPPGLIDIDTWDYDRIKETGARFALRVGITGGVIVFHPWRIRDDIKPLLWSKCKGASKMGEEDREKKFWQAVREDVLGLGDWKQYTKYGPHFHVIGFGYVENTKTVFARDGWVVKVVRNVSTGRQFTGTEMQDQIVSLVAYVLSHAMIEKGKKTPKWFGVCTPRNLRKTGDGEKIKYKCVCPKCGQSIVYWQETLDGRDYIKAIDEFGKEIPWVLMEKQYRYEIKTGARERVIRNMIKRGCVVQRLPDYDRGCSCVSFASD